MPTGSHPPHWRDKEKNKKEGVTSTIPKSKEKESSNGKVTFQSNNDDSSRSSANNCFKCLCRAYIVAECPNRRTVVLLENGEYLSEHSVETRTTRRRCLLEIEARKLIHHLLWEIMRLLMKKMNLYSPEREVYKTYITPLMKCM